MPLLHRRMRLRHDILMLDRDHWNIKPQHLARLAREIAGCRNNMLANNVALVRFDEPLAGRRPLDAGHGRVPVDLRAAVPCALGQRLRQVGRLDIPVIGMLDCADQPVSFA